MLSSKTEFVSHEILISRVTYLSIRNFMLTSFMGIEIQPEVMRAQKRDIQIHSRTGVPSSHPLKN
jgi:hypothetical protein